MMAMFAIPNKKLHYKIYALKKSTDRIDFGVVSGMDMQRLQKKLFQ